MQKYVIDLIECFRVKTSDRWYSWSGTKFNHRRRRHHQSVVKSVKDQDSGGEMAIRPSIYYTIAYLLIDWISLHIKNFFIRAHANKCGTTQSGEHTYAHAHASTRAWIIIIMVRNLISFFGSVYIKLRVKIKSNTFLSIKLAFTHTRTPFAKSFFFCSRTNSSHSYLWMYFQCGFATTTKRAAWQNQEIVSKREMKRNACRYRLEHTYTLILQYAMGKKITLASVIQFSMYTRDCACVYIRRIILTIKYLHRW